MELGIRDVRCEIIRHNRGRNGTGRKKKKGAIIANKWFI
jgi:hypothetical protein